MGAPVGRNVSAAPRSSDLGNRLISSWLSDKLKFMKMKQMTGVALIGDVVGSRSHQDRAAMQSELGAVLEQVNKAVAAEQSLGATVGDEFQAVYPDVQTAIDATLRIRLTLPAGLDCRFGLGLGAYANVGRSQYGVMQDGPAWWAAREAIVETKEREGRRNKTLRTWFCAADEQGGVPMINAFLLCRDQIVSEMNPRQRRLLLGLLEGQAQATIAKIEDISASAVSQALASSGAFAVLGAHQSLTETS